MALIAGPTASGKSALALQLAERTGGVIINADASQVYRDLRILSARPTAADEARAEHRLFGYIDGAHACSAAQWAEDAKAAIANTHAAGRLPILVGGTGLYFSTLLNGIAPVPRIDPAVREAVRALPVAEAHMALAREDAPMAARLKPADRARIARALEVIRSTGQSILHWQMQREGGIGTDIALHPLVLLPDRAELYRRCDARFAAMLAEGAMDEARRLIDRGLNPDLPVMRAIGVPELAAVIRDEMPLEAAIAAARQATRNYAKRQFTWFRRQPSAAWPRVASAEEAAPFLGEPLRS